MIEGGEGRGRGRGLFLRFQTFKQRFQTFKQRDRSVDIRMFKAFKQRKHIQKRQRTGLNV
jgi:hypothetical protein